MTNPTRIVFHAYSAYVGRVIGPTRCAFWYDDPATLNWDPALLVEVDLANNVTNARASGTAVEVDDHTIDGGRTTIGPRFPGGRMIGGVWLSETFVATLKANPKGPDHSYDYEFRTIVYDNDPKYGNRRFNGYHARILNTQTSASGVLTLVQLWRAGTGKNSGPVGTFWLDLDAIAHEVAADATQVGSKGAQQEGALFLDDAMKSSFSPTAPSAIATTTFSTADGPDNDPKIPRSLGY